MPKPGMHGQTREEEGPSSDWGIMNLMAVTSRRRLTAVAGALSAIAVSFAVQAAPASAKPGTLAGNWESVDIDGSNQTLRLRGAGHHVYSAFYHDDRTSGICGGSPAKVVGRAVVDGNELVLRGTLVCLPGGNPLPGQERVAFTFHWDSGTDTLTDQTGVVWERD